MLLAIETAETACSAALSVGATIVDERHEMVGRGHAERLIPMIGDLLQGRRPGRILVDCGPGSFTGVRVGIAAARALALGWQVPVSGYSAMTLIAASGFSIHDGHAIAVVMAGGHGQIFVQCFQRAPFGALGPLKSLVPEEAAAMCKDIPLALGSGAPALAAAGWAGRTGLSAPRAADVRLLAEADRSLPPVPIYGRLPDARPSAG